MPSSDYKVEIVDSSGEADMSVSIVGDQVVDLDSALPGQILVVQEDGTIGFAVAEQAPIKVRNTAQSFGSLVGAAPAWVDVDNTGSAASRTYDLVFPAVKAGQWIQVTPHMVVANGTGGTAFDMWTIVAGSPVHQFGTGAGGVTSWFVATTATEAIGGACSYQVQADDLSNVVNGVGSVRCRMRFGRVNTSSTGITVGAGYYFGLEGRGPLG